MKTFNLSVSFEEAQIVGFAIAKGYHENVSSVNEEGETVTIPNPVTATDFCAEYFRAFLATEFSTIGMAHIMAQKEAEKNTAIAQLQTALKEAVTISVE